MINGKTFSVVIHGGLIRTISCACNISVVRVLPPKSSFNYEKEKTRKRTPRIISMSHWKNEFVSLCLNLRSIMDRSNIVNQR